MRRLGVMDHDECAPWCDHDPANHAEDCTDAFCYQAECMDRQPVILLVEQPVIA